MRAAFREHGTLRAALLPKVAALQNSFMDLCFAPRIKRFYYYVYALDHGYRAKMQSGDKDSQP